ncbi:MAG: hypothetical protein LBT59_26720 [Clostridiales bacterium]|nr:hypothetical protein [Clostridiales bacterium]
MPFRNFGICSYCHRDYFSSQLNEVLIFKNRIEIYNPGLFPIGLTPEDFIENDRPPVNRNPLLARLISSKDPESPASSLKRITSVCEKAGVKVEFLRKKLGFTTVFYRP